ncbi:hypothetical protein JXQ31_08625 [candidate division KSB1 bacterium]|nr:hypothetical protein [candidate division KSB1 bacterium]
MQISDAYGTEPTIKGAGSLYDVVAPQKNNIWQAGQWNYVTIIARGKKLLLN